MGAMPPNQLISLKAPNALVFTSNTRSNWKASIQDTTCATATGITGHTEQVQCCIFLHVVGEEVQNVHANMTFTAALQDKINPHVHAFQDYWMGRANIIITQFHFNMHNQAMETMKAYITALKDMVKYCDYSTLEDSLLRDCLVAGVCNTTLHNQLNYGLNTNSEVNAKQLETKHDCSIMQEVDYIWAADSGYMPAHNAHTGSRAPAWRSGTSQTAANNNNRQCRNCGYDHARGICPAIGRHAWHVTKPDISPKFAAVNLKQPQGA